jgi:hypothetical protein
MGAEDLAELLAALSESVADQGVKGGGQGGGYQGRGTADQAQAGGLDVGRWEEAGSRDSEAFADSVSAGQVQGESPILGGVGSSAEAVGDLGLEGDGDGFGRVVEAGEIDQDGGGDGIGEVADHMPGGREREGLAEPVEGVGDDQLEEGLGGESAFEDAGEALVFFDSNNGEGQGE